MTARVKRTSEGISFTCPGCGDTHSIPIEGMATATAGRCAWAWNQSAAMPTITPSLDVRCGHYSSHHKDGDSCWCGKGYGIECYRCHSVITDGKIMFCADSSHALAGQTVDLPAIPADKEM